MKEVLDELQLCLSECTRLAEGLAKKHGRVLDSFPLWALSVNHNHLRLALEHCEFYYRLWSQTPDPQSVSEINRKRRENAERIVAATKMLFVFVLSAMEYSINEANKVHRSVIGLDPSKRNYLSHMMGKSHASGLIDRLTYDYWCGAVELRNIIVHNNGVAERTGNIDPAPGVTFAMAEGQMMQVSPLTLLPVLVRWTIRAYAEWCDSFLSRASVVDAKGS